MSLFDNDFLQRLHAMSSLVPDYHRSIPFPHQAAEMAIQSHALPDLPTTGNDNSKDAQRAWKTVLDGGTIGNIVAVDVNKSPQVVTLAGPNNQAKVLAVTLIPPLATFGPSLGIGPTNTGHPSASALLQWGVGGGVCSAEIDIGRGAAFTLVASALRIFIRRETENGVTAVGPISYGACVALGPVANPTRMTRTFRSREILPAGMIPGATIDITAPPYAKFVTVYSFGIAQARAGASSGQRACNISFLSSNGLDAGNINTGLNQIPPLLEMPNQAAVVEATNSDPALTVDQQYVFELAL